MNHSALIPQLIAESFRTLSATSRQPRARRRAGVRRQETGDRRQEARTSLLFVKNPNHPNPNRLGSRRANRRNELDLVK